MDPSLPTSRGARDRGGPGRGRRRDARARAADARARRPRRPVRPPGVHRLARPLPDLVARATRRPARGRGLARGGARAGRRATPREANVDPGHGLARRRLVASIRRARRSTRSPASTPAALWSKDYHSLWLNTRRRSRGRGGDLDVPGGVVERDADGSRPGSSARSPRGASASATSRSRRTSGSRRPARGSASRTRAASPRSTTRTAGSARTAIFGRIHEHGRADAARLAVASGRARRRARRARRCAPASATTTCGSAT